MGRQHIAATNTSMPSYAEWERMSGGTRGRDLPLLKFIDKRMYEHSILTRHVAQFHRMKAEREACLVQLWNATRLYMKSQEGPGTFSRARRGPVRADSGRVVDLGAAGRHNRGDTVAALHGIVADELRVLMGAANEVSMKAMLKASRVCQMKPDARAKDFEGEQLIVRYLSRDERAKYRVIFENGLAMMHPRDAARSPLDWVPADTCDQLTTKASYRNVCFTEMFPRLQDASDWDTFNEGSAAAAAYWQEAKPVNKYGVDGYVLTHGRKLYMSPDHESGWFFHSAYTAGGCVACSGSMTFEEGVPKLLTNWSGHYRPEPQDLERVLRLFEMAGLPLNRLRISVDRKNGFPNFYGSVEEFRRALRAGIT